MIETIKTIAAYIAIVAVVFIVCYFQASTNKKSIQIEFHQGIPK